MIMKRFSHSLYLQIRPSEGYRIYFTFLRFSKLDLQQRSFWAFCLNWPWNIFQGFYYGQFTVLLLQLFCRRSIQVPYKPESASAALLHCFFGFLTASGNVSDYGSRSSKNERSLLFICLRISSVDGSVNNSGGSPTQSMYIFSPGIRSTGIETFSKPKISWRKSLYNL